MTITYLVDGYYNPADELGVAWDDPAIAADWGLTDPILSDRDQANPRRGRHRAAVAAARQPAHLSARSTTMRLFVTGGAGFIGSNYVRHVLETTDDEVTVFDALTYAGNLENLADLRGRPPLHASCTATSATATRSPRRCPATTPWCTSRPRATSTARCSTPTCSCAPTARAPT